MPETTDPAAALAARFYELLRERGRAVGVTRFFTVHAWQEAPGEVREALTDVFAQLMREAQEQREEWTRAFIEAEVRRTAAALESSREPGRYTTILERLPAAARFRLQRQVWPPPEFGSSFREDASESIGGDEFVRLRALDGQTKKAGRELLRLRDSIHNAAAVERERAESAPEEVSKVRATAAERFDLFAVELESIIYEGGFAPKPRGEEGSAEA